MTIHLPAEQNLRLYEVEVYGEISESLAHAYEHLALKWLGHFFQNVISFSDAIHLMCNIFYMKLVQYNECLVSIVDTGGLVL